MGYPQQFWRVFGYLPRNVGSLINFLYRNPPEPISHLQPHQLLSAPQLSRTPSAPEPATTSSAICAGTLQNLVYYRFRNLVYYLHRDSPTGTLRNLMSHLHQGASELPLKAPGPSGTFSGTCCCSCAGSRQNLSGLGLRLGEYIARSFWFQRDWLIRGGLLILTRHYILEINTQK